MLKEARRSMARKLAMWSYDPASGESPEVLWGAGAPAMCQQRKRKSQNEKEVSVDYLIVRSLYCCLFKFLYCITCMFAEISLVQYSTQADTIT